MKKFRFRKRSQNVGFTLVELVIVIAIVIVLSVVSVPIYRSHVDKAKLSEGYALLGVILSAQKSYYSENGNFLKGSVGWTGYDPILGIDARGNKYFTWFHSGSTETDPKNLFRVAVYKPEDLLSKENKWFTLTYNITTGMTFKEMSGY